MLADVNYPATPTMVNMLQQLYTATPKTQKARGLQGLIHGKGNCPRSDYSYRAIFWMSCRDNLGSVPDTMAITQLLSDWFSYTSGGQIMARPCPVTPRHGFVGSRLVETVKELRAVCHETYTADPRGEILLMPFLEDATHSAVLTNQGLSIGSGHDGATAGRDAVLIPCHSDIVSWIDDYLGDMQYSRPHRTQFLTRSRYIGYTKDPKRQPYLELVDKTIVQARYGPMTHVGATCHCPTTESSISFSCVWEPSTALLNDFALFETTLREKIQEAKNNSNYICLYLPHGTLSCHAAVQGICYGAAVVTGPEKPVEHKVIQISCAESPKCQLTSLHAQIQAGLLLGEQTDLTHEARPHSVMWATAVIQGMASVPLTPQSAKFLATATTILVRAGLMACFGEHRHFKDLGIMSDKQAPIGPMSPRLKTPFQTAVVDSTRATYYARISHPSLLKPKTLYTLLGKVQAIESDFTDCEWQLHMGGPAWARCTQAARRMLIAYMRLKFRPTPQPSLSQFHNQGRLAQELRAAVAASNFLLTVSHNNGKCLTKFVEKRVLGGITHAPGLYLMHPLTHEVINGLPKPELHVDKAGTDETVS